MATFQVARPLLSFVGLSVAIALWTIPYLRYNFKIASAHKKYAAATQNWTGHVQDQKTLNIWPCFNHNYSMAKLVYNRVPKCGSNSVVTIIRKLKDRNGFHFFEDKTYTAYTVLRGRNLSNFAQMIYNFPTPSIYERHIFYVDFHQFGLQQPMYINLVRDPLEQRISGYYYMRFGRDGQNLTAWQKQRRTDKQKAQTFDDCVFYNTWECNAKGPLVFMMTKFFCGHDDICMQPTQAAVEKAKENIRRHYAVVGVLEEFSSFLKVLEVVMPQFFRGAHDTWREIGSKLMKMQKTSNKRPASEKAREVMRERLHLDYQVYDFIKERFHRQKSQLGIKD
ncbi:uronyl 2-sulfotransferase-like [Branchiostoma floridae]|uniref:Uronyl 2-sulfotransferase-like n=1 Tax=Branchiostoma floridae TaxID=7739 RepID=A0A9J7MWN2_BRAFL|nr:uronyl 2-sulfotransferase-like [Branchiostoma floridae]